MKKIFIMTALVVGMIVGSSFGAVSGGYCHSAEYYRQKRKPVAPAVTSVSERERIATMELETARLNLRAAKISAGVASSDEPEDAARRKAQANIITKGEPVSQVKEKAQKGISKYQLMMSELYELTEKYSAAAKGYLAVFHNGAAMPSERTRSKEALRALIRNNLIAVTDVSVEDRRLLNL